MKKKAWVIFVVSSLAFFGLGYYSYSSFIRGIGIAVKEPDQKVVEELDRIGSYPPEAPNPSTSTIAGFPLVIPPSFSISLFAKGLENPRVMVWDCAGNMVVSLTSAGRVIALPDNDSNGKADKMVLVKDGLRKPHGLAFNKLPDGRCQLYIAEEDKVSLFDYDVSSLKASFLKKLIDLPYGSGHFTRTLLISKDRLFVSVGSSCNVCHEKDDKRASVLAMDLDGGNVKTYARGLRNAVFMAEHPASGKIWATEMGRDFLGDNLPPDEINILEEGKNYGWPNCYGKNIHDSDFDKNTYIRNPCMEPFETPSIADIPAHSAPLGIAFFAPGDWPADLAGDMLVALHGSWNRSQPSGYKIVRYKLSEDGQVESVEDFISGFLGANGKKYGRPAGILIEQGVIYISDDSAGAIYKLAYRSSEKKCVKTGCSGQVCSDRELVTDCGFRPEYACYRSAICEADQEGGCAWRQTDKLKKCLENPDGT